MFRGSTFQYFLFSALPETIEYTHYYNNNNNKKHRKTHLHNRYRKRNRCNAINMIMWPLRCRNVVIINNDDDDFQYNLYLNFLQLARCVPQYLLINQMLCVRGSITLNRKENRENRHCKTGWITFQSEQKKSKSVSHTRTRNVTSDDWLGKQLHLSVLFHKVKLSTFQCF